MYINKATFILLVLVFIFSFSCRKYLDKKPDNTRVVPTKINELQALLDDEANMNNNNPSMGEAAADDYYLLQNNYNSLVEFWRKYYIWNFIPYNYRNDWSDCYTVIYNANYCIEQISEVDKDVNNMAAWNNVKGGAHFYRAYYFSRLAWIFAKSYDASTAETDLGIVLRLSSDFNVPSQRASVEETYQQIIRDAKEAATLLPDLPSHVLRPSKVAAFGLLAEVYLTMRNYDSAHKYADLCLSIKPDLLDYSSSEVNLGANTPFQEFNKEILFYSQMNILSPNVTVLRAKIDTSLVNSYVGSDKRKQAYFRSSGGGWRFKGGYSSSTIFLFTGIATDEIYLIRAECNARANRLSDALEDLNFLLLNRHDNSFSPITATTSNDALSIILQERRKELVMRDRRWSDIKRLNKEGYAITPTRIIDGMTYTLPPNDPRYALPLPDDIVRLTGVAQN